MHVSHCIDYLKALIFIEYYSSHEHINTNISPNTHLKFKQFVKIKMFNYTIEMV